MTTNLDDAVRQILRATSYVELFGACPEGVEPETHAKSAYRQLARLTHPDFCDDKKAGEAFAKLTRLYQEASTACEYGEYGQAPVFAMIRSRKATHSLRFAWGNGDLCDTYLADSQPKSGTAQRTFCKVVRTATDNDMIKIEAEALKKLNEAAKMAPFFPTLLDSFRVGSGSNGRQTNVLAALDDFYSLTDVRHVYTSGVTPLDMAWMWRRILWALAHAHSLGIIHGAITPDHVLIQPDLHGLVLADWSYASVANDAAQPRLTAIIDRYRDWYPPEVLARQSPGAATDLYMAARCMIYIMGGDPVTGAFSGDHVPVPFRAYFRGCILKQQNARPQDALMLLAEFDELLKRLGAPYYPRRFRTFAMPTGAA